MSRDNSPNQNKIIVESNENMKKIKLNKQPVTTPTESEENMSSIYEDQNTMSEYDDPNNSQTCSKDHNNEEQNNLDYFPSQGPRSSTPLATENKSILNRIQERLLKQTKDEVCNMVADTDDHIKLLMERLKKIEADTETETKRNEELDKAFMCILCMKKKRGGRSKKEYTEIECEPSRAEKRNRRRDKRNKTPTNLYADAEMAPKLKLLVDEMNELKSKLMEYKHQNQILEKLRRKSDHVDDFDFSNEQIRCHEKNDKLSMKDIILKKEELLADINCKDKEIARLNERKAELVKENELYSQKIKEAKDFMNDVQADEILANADKDEIKIVKNQLINKEIEWDDVKYKLNQAKVIVQDLKESLEDRQKIVNHYKQQCTQIEEARKKQMESVSDMDDQYNQVIDKLNNDFLTFKTKMCSEVQQFLPMVDKIKTALKRLADSDKLLKTARNSHDDMKTEVSKLLSKIEILNEEIHAIKKGRQLTEKNNENLDNELFVLENDLEVQKKNYYQLVERNQEIKLEIRQANAKAEEKEKELTQLRLLKQNLQERIAEENQHKISGYESICNTESYLMNLKQELEAELEKCDTMLRSKVGCSHPNLTKREIAATKPAKSCLLDTKLKLEDVKCVDDKINALTLSANNLPQGNLEDIKSKMLDVLRNCQTEEYLPIGNVRNIERAVKGLDFLDCIIVSEEQDPELDSEGNQIQDPELDSEGNQIQDPELDSEGNLVVSTMEIT